jgi:hypothetical protein
VADFRRVDSGPNHWYLLNGRRIPGVTYALGNGFPKPALVNWAAGSVADFVANNPELINGLRDQPEALVRMLKGIPNDDRDRAARRGTQVHRLAEGIVRGDEVEVPEELAGHVDSYLRFLDDWRPRDEIVEGTGYSAKGFYAGTFDLIATLVDGKRWLLDLKTTRSGVFLEAALQLSAYQRFEVYVGDDGQHYAMPAVDRCGVVWVRADGYDLVPVNTSEGVYHAFRWAYGVAEFRRGADDQHHEDWPHRYIGAPLSPPRRLEAVR